MPTGLFNRDGLILGLGARARVPLYVGEQLYGTVVRLVLPVTCLLDTNRDGSCKSHPIPAAP